MSISAEEALEELTDVYRMYFHRKTPDSGENTQLNKLVTLTKRQEAILRAISPKLLL